MQFLGLFMLLLLPPKLDDFGEELLPPRLPSGITETRAIDA